MAKINRLHRQVLQRLVSGQSMAEIAWDLQLSEQTIRLISSSAATALNATNIYDAIRIYRATCDINLSEAS